MAMLQDPSRKYRPFPQVALADRRWPGRTIARPPRWLSTDLRDGNQAIVDPMDAVKKNRFFDLLVEIGLKEIEIGFPAAGQTEFDFISGLVSSGKIPDDVIVQVLTQSREDLIRTSFASLEGAIATLTPDQFTELTRFRQNVQGLDADIAQTRSGLDAKVSTFVGTATGQWVELDASLARARSAARPSFPTLALTRCCGWSSSTTPHTGV